MSLFAEAYYQQHNRYHNLLTKLPLDKTCLQRYTDTYKTMAGYSYRSMLGLLITADYWNIEWNTKDVVQAIFN